MIGAVLYLTRRTLANSLRRRVARLREPRYVLALAMGLLYFYWIFARPGGARLGRPSLAEADRAALETLLAWLLLGFVAVNWVLGQSRTPLPFTRAETQFLFTAPLTRRQVITFKLLRLQLPLLASATISVLLFSQGHITPARLLQAAGTWLAFTTMSLHFAAASFVRANLAEHGITGVRRQVVVLGVLLGVVGLCAWSIRDALPALSRAADVGVSEFFAALGALSDRGALKAILFPFRLAVAPVAARTGAAFLAALPGALALLAAHYLWVVRSAIHFEDVAIEDANRRARRLAAARRGRFEVRSGSGKLARPIYPLRPVGSAAEAFLWKSVLAVTRQIGSRLLVVLGLGVAAVALLASSGASQPGSGRLAAGGVLMVYGGMAVLFGPRVLRQDLREDLLLLDVLKAYPVRGRDIVVGESLGLTALLTVFVWLSAGLGFALMMPALTATASPPLWIVIAVGAAVLVPGVVLVQVAGLNGFAVLFPAWSALGTQVSAGVERLGQQIVVMVGSLILLLLVLIPAAIAAGIIAAVFVGISPHAAIVAAASAGSAVLVFEAYLGMYFIGARLDTTDPADVPGTD